jgi:hypothetical protein
MHTHCHSLTKQTWQHYLEACSESAVVSEQKKWEARVSTTPVTDELAFVGDLIARKCPTCNRYMARSNFLNSPPPLMAECVDSAMLLATRIMVHTLET